MPPPTPKTNRFARAVLLTAAGLGMGGVLGYSLCPAPAVAPARPEISASRLAGPSQPPGAGIKNPEASGTPYPVDAVMNGGLQSLADFEAWLAGASCEDVTREMLDPAINGWPTNTAICSLLASRFREFTADERFSCLQRHLQGPGQGLQTSLHRILIDLAKAALPRREEDLLALLKKGDQLPYALASGLTDWAAADLPSVLAFVGKLEGYYKEDILGSLISGLVNKDPSLARREALKLPFGRARGAALDRIVSRMGAEDLPGAIAWLKESNLIGESAFGNPLRSALSSAAAKDPAAAAQVLLDLPGVFEEASGSAAIAGLFRQWATSDSAACAAWLKDHPLPQRHEKTAQEALATVRWSGLPLDEALTTYDTLPESARGEFRGNLVNRLLTEDPAHAVERLAAVFPDKSSASEVWTNLLQQLSNEQLPQAISQFPDLADRLGKDGFLLHRLANLPDADLDSLLPRLPEKARDAVRSKFLEDKAFSDPVGTLNIARSMEKDQLSPYVSGSVTVSLLQADPAQAVDWVNEFPESENKEWAALNLASNWARSDPAATTAWLKTLPAGRTRDRATAEAAAVQGISGNSDYALSLAAGIQDEKIRTDATGRALQTLWKRDTAAGAKALQSTGLGADQQAAITKKLNTGGYRN